MANPRFRVVLSVRHNILDTVFTDVSDTARDMFRKSRYEVNETVEVFSCGYPLTIREAVEETERKKLLEADYPVLLALAALCRPKLRGRIFAFGDSISPVSEKFYPYIEVTPTGIELRAKPETEQLLKTDQILLVVPKI